MFNKICARFSGLTIMSFFLCVFSAPWFAHAQIETDSDDDFIILDDRGEGVELEDDDVPLSGRKPRRPTGSTPSQTRNPDGSVTENGEPEPEVAPPKRFEPTERVSEDLSVSFPADI